MDLKEKLRIYLEATEDIVPAINIHKFFIEFSPREIDKALEEMENEGLVEKSTGFFNSNIKWTATSKLRIS